MRADVCGNAAGLYRRPTGLPTATAPWPPPFPGPAAAHGHSLGEGFSQVDDDRRLLAAAPEALVERHLGGTEGDERLSAGRGGSLGAGAGRGPHEAEDPSWPRRSLTLPFGGSGRVRTPRRSGAPGTLGGGASRVLPPSRLGRLRDRLDAFPARDWRRELRILPHSS